MCRTQSRFRARQRGLSMIEMLIALGVGVVLMLVVSAIALTSSRSQSELSKTSRQVENGRYALQLLSREIELAGFYGELIDLPAAPETLPNPCDPSIASLTDGLALPIQAYDGDVATLIPSCVTDAGHVPGTDVLVLRRTATEDSTGALESGEIYLQTRSSALALGNPSALPAGPEWNGFPIRRWRTDIYFIGRTDDGPALRRLELQAGAIGAATAVTLADGIERMRFDFGLDQSGDGSPNATESKAAYVAVPGVDELQDVVAIRVHLLARNPEPTPGYADDKTYRLGVATTGDAHVVNPDGQPFKRHVYSATVRAMNRSARRE